MSVVAKEPSVVTIEAEFVSIGEEGQWVLKPKNIGITVDDDVFLGVDLQVKYSGEMPPTSVLPVVLF